MDDFRSFDTPAQDIGYFIFMDPGEKTVICARGILDQTIAGHLVLTTKKLFFFFWSNINRDKKFIATYPYLLSAEIKSGILFSTITVSSRKETFAISRIRKSRAADFMKKLGPIIADKK